MITATIRLQHFRNGRKAFVQRPYSKHGMGVGQVEYYEVTGNSWAEIRRMLKDQDVMGYSGITSGTVQGFSTGPQVGPRGASIRRLQQIPEGHRYKLTGPADFGTTANQGGAKP